MTFHTWPSGELKVHAMELLVVGVLLFEQWANVFANPRLEDWPGLKAKAFAVWFPTMIDFLKSKGDLERLSVELQSRNIECSELFERARRLADCFRDVLRLYTIDEQIFLRDRRLQNVHGRLHIYIRDEHKIQVYDKETDSLQRVVLTADGVSCYDAAVLPGDR